MVFYELRQQTDTIQALLQQSTEISKQMYKFAASISPESIVLVKGTIKKSPIEINATSVKDSEIHIAEVAYPLAPAYPITDLGHLTIRSPITFSAGGCPETRNGRGIISH